MSFPGAVLRTPRGWYDCPRSGSPWQQALQTTARLGKGESSRTKRFAAEPLCSGALASRYEPYLPAWPVDTRRMKSWPLFLRSSPKMLPRRLRLPQPLPKKTCRYPQFREFMKIKLDENLPSLLVVPLSSLGHDVHTVADENLTGKADNVVWETAQAEGRFWITQDMDFSDLRLFAPGTHSGMLLLAWTIRTSRF